MHKIVLPWKPGLRLAICAFLSGLASTFAPAFGQDAPDAILKYCQAMVDQDKACAKEINPAHEAQICPHAMAQAKSLHDDMLSRATTNADRREINEIYATFPASDTEMMRFVAGKLASGSVLDLVVDAVGKLMIECNLLSN